MDDCKSNDKLFDPKIEKQFSYFGEKRWILVCKKKIGCYSDFYDEFQILLKNFGWQYLNEGVYLSPFSKLEDNESKEILKLKDSFKDVDLSERYEYFSFFMTEGRINELFK
jgi:hypothetical protein